MSTKSSYIRYVAKKSSFYHINPFMHNVVKWPDILKNLAVFTPQDF